jgi:death-on-curing protein
VGESLANHPFIDGNKRVAITVTAAFLRVNGYRLLFQDLDAYQFVNGLYEQGKFQRERLEEWLRIHAFSDDSMN